MCHLIRNKNYGSNWMQVLHLNGDITQWIVSDRDHMLLKNENPEVKMVPKQTDSKD